jgi:hypothetical protein
LAPFNEEKQCQATALQKEAGSGRFIWSSYNVTIVTAALLVEDFPSCPLLRLE